MKNKILLAMFVLLLTGCSTHVKAPPGQQPGPLPVPQTQGSNAASQPINYQLTDYQQQVALWYRDRAAMLEIDRQERNAAREQERIDMYLEQSEKNLVIKKEAEVRLKAIEMNPVFGKDAGKNGGAASNDDLKDKCLNGFDCNSGGCQFPPDEVCRQWAEGQSDDSSQASIFPEGGIVLIGSTVENITFMSPGSLTGSNRSTKTMSHPVQQAATNQNGNAQGGRRQAPVAFPTPPKSGHEVWAGTLSGMWSDAIGLAKSVAPWFFGAEVLKTAFTSPNNYVEAGDDLTSGGGDNNTSRGDYDYKPVSYAPAE
jgi:hypothetical protein